MSKHPKGLAILFFTEMWERFSFYGMRVLLVLFLVSETNGGFGWNEGDALTLLGLYMMAGYMMGIPGGMLADKFLGQKKAVMIGGSLLCAGHLLMAVPAVWSFYVALVLIILGVGLLKPNVSTMVGSLYKQGDPLRDEGFTIFYMGINLGAFLATLLVSYVGERIGWHYGFSLAGFGMLLGQAVFVYGRKYLTQVGNLEVRSVEQQQTGVKTPMSYQEKDRMKVLVLILAVVGMYVVAFEQAGGLLTLYANNYTDRMVFGFEIPAGMFQSLNSGFILIFGAVVAGYWVRRGKRGGAASSIFKIGVGALIVGLGYLFMIGASLQRTGSADGKSALFWLVAAYLFHTIGELCLSPVSLSFVTKIAPKRMAGAIMGVYWAVYGFSNFLAALVGKLAGKLGELAIFGGLFAITALMGILLAVFSNRLNALTHGAEEEPEKTNHSAVMELPETASA